MTDNKHKGFLDKIAINQLVKIITDFILAILKMFSPNDSSVEPRKRTPLKDILDRWFK